MIFRILEDVSLNILSYFRLALGFFCVPHFHAFSFSFSHSMYSTSFLVFRRLSVSMFFHWIPLISLDLRSQIYLNASTIVDEQWLCNNDDNFRFVYFHSLSCTVIFLFFHLESNFSVPFEWFCCIMLLVCHMQLWKLNQINVKVTLTVCRCNCNNDWINLVHYHCIRDRISYHNSWENHKDVCQRCSGLYNLVLSLL